MISSVLSNVSPGTSYLLSYVMLVIVAIFLVSSALLTYFYWRKAKRTRTSPTPSPATPV